MNTEKSKANEPQKLFPNFSQRLDLNSSNKYVFHENLPFYYTWENNATVQRQ